MKKKDPYCIRRPIPQLQLLGLVVMIIIFLLSMTTAQGQNKQSSGAILINAECPVMKGEEASAKFQIKYQGKPVRFCCKDCIEEFMEDTHLYVGNLPQFNALTSKTSADAPRVTIKKTPGIQPKKNLAQYIDDYLSPITFCIGLLILFSIRFLVLSYYPKHKLSTLAQRITTVPALLIYLLLAFANTFIVDKYKKQNLNQDIHNLRQNANKQRTALTIHPVHGATFHDFMDPPVPARNIAKPTVKSTYYRGNDGRKPNLWNGGFYRTCQFNLSIKDQHDNTVNHGDNLQDKILFIRCEIVRAQNTPDRYWAPKMINKFFATKSTDKIMTTVPDRVNYTTLEPMQRWEVRYPLTNFTAKQEKDGNSKIEGLFYLKEVRGKRENLGGRIHYGIQFEFYMKDGILLPKSDMWMGYLYRTRTLPSYMIQPEEWLSLKPIPELPFPTRLNFKHDPYTDNVKWKPQNVRHQMQRDAWLKEQNPKEKISPDSN